MAVASVPFGQCAWALNTEDDVKGAATDLGTNSTATYNAVATTTSDVTFAAGTPYAGSLTLNNGTLSIGTLNDLNAAAISITGNKLLTLNSAANVVAPAGTNGGNAADLLFVIAGGNLSINDSTGIAFANSGSVDNLGTLSLGTSPLAITTGKIVTFTGAGSTTVAGATTNTSGAIVVNAPSGTVTFSGNNLNTGGFTLTAGTLRATTSTGALGNGLLSLGGGELQLANTSSANLNFGRNTTVTGNAQITSDTTALNTAGDTFTLGTLSIGAQTLTIAGGSNVNSGTAGVTFGATTLTGATTFAITNPTNGGTTLLTLGAVTNGANTATFTGNGNFAQSGVWANGAGGITFGVSGGTVYSGTATLNQANTYLGTTTINSGTVRATGNAGALGAGTLSLGGGVLQLANATSANLSFGRNTTVTGNAQITSDTTALNTAGDTFTLGTLSIGAQTLTIAGGSNVNSGTAGVTFGATTLTGATTFAITNPTNGGTTLLTLGAVTNGANTATFTGNGNFAQSGVWANGAGGITFGVSGGTVYSGTATLNQANTYLGTTTINSGTVRATGNAGALGAGTLSLGGGVLQLANATSANLNFGRNTTVTGNAQITSDTTALNTAGDTFTLGTLSIGAQTLTIAGGSNVNSGTAGVTFGATTLTGATTFAITNPTNGGTTLLTLGAVTNGANTATFTGNGNFAQSGVWGNGAGGITFGVSGGTVYSGTATLNQANTYLGTTTINSGTVRATGNAGALGAGTLSLGGGVLQLANAAGTNLTFGSNTTVTGNAQITSDTTAANTAGDTFILGTLGIGAQTLTIAGGNNVNSGTAGVTFGATTLSGATTFNITNPTSGGTTLLTLGAVANGGNTATFTGNGNFAQSGVWSGAGGITFGGSGTATLNQANTYTGTTTINGGVVNAGVAEVTNTSGPFGKQLANAPGTIVFGGGTLQYSSVNNTDYSGRFATTAQPIKIDTNGRPVTFATSLMAVTSGSLTLNDTNANKGTLTLTGANSYTGTTTVAAGTLEFAKQVSYYNNNLGGNQTAANTIVQPGATLAFEVGNTGGFTAANLATYNGFGTATTGFENGSFLGIDTTGATFTYASPITNTNGGTNVIGLNKLGTNSLILTAASTYTGPTTVSAGTLQLGTGVAGANGSLASPSIADSGTLLFAPAPGTTESYSGSIGGGGGVTINGNATGTTTLLGGNTYTGTTTVTSGTLNLANSLALQNSNLAPASATDVTFDSGVTSNAFTIGALSNNQNLVLNNTAGAGINLTIGNVTTNASTGPYTAVFSGLGGITEAGYRNTLTLTGANTYSGTTTVTGGTLNLGNGGANGSIGVGGNGGPLVLGGFDNGGTLAYTRTGTVAQTFSGTTINAGGNAITESTATQTINLGAITSNPGGTVDIGSTGTVTTTSGNTNGILGGYATYGGKTTFAVAPSTPGGAITGLSAYTTTATAGTTPANYLDQNIDVSTVTPTGAITPNSLRFNTASQTLTLTGVNTVTSGGILVTPTGGSSTINGGFLTGSAGGQLAVSSADQNFAINSTIEDNGAATAVTLSSNSSAGRYFSLGSGNNSFSGGVFINGGGINVPGNNSTALGVGTVTFGNQIYTGAAGGGITFGTFTKVLTSGLLASAYSDNVSNGEISGNSGGIWELVGSGTATFSGIIGSYSPGRVVNPQLDSGTQIFGNQQIGISNLIVNGGTFQLGTGYWGSISNSKQNVALTVGGGTYVQFGNYAGTTSQVYNSGLTVNSGASTITVNGNGGAGTVLSFAANNTRSVGGTVDFNLPSTLGGAQTASNGITTNQLNINGIMAGYATVSGTDWATNATNTAGGNVIGLSNSTINAYTPSVAGTTAPGATANVDFQASNTTSFGTQTINSLRFNTAAANTLSNAGTLTVASAGILETANVGANLTTISGGTLIGFPGGDLIVIQNNAAAGMTISSTIANNGAATGLTKSGPGLLTLTGPNTYTGGLFLNGGTLNAATTNINGGSTTNGITFNGGTLQAATTGGITTAKAITINPNGGTVDTNGNSVTFSGNLTGGIAVGAGLIGSFDPTGEASFTKTGAGTLTLSGAANAFTGAFIINNGTVLDGAAAAGTLGSGYLTFGNNANTPTVDLNGRSATVAGLIGAGSNGLITSGVVGTSTLTLNGAYSETYGGVIQNGSGTVALTENLNNATETVTLTGADTYTGATTVTSGNLQIGNGTAGTLNSSAISVASGMTVSFDEPTGNTVNGAITNSGTVVGNEGTGITNTLGGNITGAGAFTQTGAGATVLTGAANSYSGATTVNAGTLQVGDGTNGIISNSSASTVAFGATLAFNEANGGSYSGTIANAGTVAGVETTGNTNTLGGNITGAGAFTQTGAGATVLTGAANSYSGATTVNAGTLQVGDGTNGIISNSSASTVAFGATLAFNEANGGSYSGTIANAGTVAGVETTGNTNTLGGNITGAGAFTQTGAGATVLTGAANSYSGATTVNAGTLQVGNGTSGIISNSSASTVASGATLAFNEADGGSYSGTIANAGTVAGIETTGTNTLAGNITGAGGFTQSGAGTTVLTGGANGYSGPTAVTAGTLQVGDGTSGIISNSSASTVASGATLAFNEANGGSYTGTIGNAGTVTGAEISGNTNTLGGAISGAGGFTQSGAGATILSTANSYAGPTTVNAGTLALSAAGTAGSSNGGTLGATAITVNTGGTLLLNASNAIGTSSLMTLVGGTFNANGQSDGSNSGTAITSGMGNLTLSANSTLDFGVTSSNSTLVYSGLSLGTYSLAVNDWSGTAYPTGGTDAGTSAQDRLLFTTDPGFGLGTSISSISFYDQSGNFLGNGQELAFGSGYEIAPVSSVPEPTTVFGALALLGLVGYRERRRLAGLAAAWRNV